MSLVLLSAAALLGQSLRNLEHQNFGFETQGRYIAWINPMLGNYKPEQMEPLFRQIDDRLRTDSRRAHGGAGALCAHDGRQLERRHSRRRAGRSPAPRKTQVRAGRA